MTHIFTYGSLMFEKVFNEVVHGDYQSCPGKVSGFVRRSILHEHYPAMLPGPVNSTIEGVLYLDIDLEDLTRLDEFEGSIYDRRGVRVMTENNIYASDAYVLRESYRNLASDQDWDPQKFEEHTIDQFLGTYFGFDR
ncbi:MAG: gamma-glutamylcyclotransferase [Desulfofustis sp.]|nr:gamma-glutamylcyclotransferase [Desulfofustis sp.]RZW21268.1 MAG: gamma-glutamylcyclotransferase [Desulfobulbaceae bacterium]MBT8345554.1 gamma-glutamylcyclotransferase [Desulfofustis sp.]MBT8353470.1 gamma-glutamylcyclotransferase [Desulfofustis sp.]NNF45803.1 gamma-glutamylcyclotransferase [Desulfofustis sp.]